VSVVSPHLFFDHPNSRDITTRINHPNLIFCTSVMERLTLSESTFDACISRATAILAEGGLVVYPTETMYGIGADATNAEAVSKALAFKNRPAGKAISVLVADAKTADAYVERTEEARKAYAAFLPGPVTVISRSLGAVDDRLPSEFGTLGIRISSHPFAMAMAHAFGRPITSTSANPTGGARPYAVDGMIKQLSPRQAELIDLVIDAGTLPRREPSTVIDTTTGVQQVIRAGAVLAEVAPALQTHSAEETAERAFELMNSFKHAITEKAVVFALEGDMGMGKTHFAKGLAQALGVRATVTSPSYVLVKEYEGEGCRFVHMDCWRTENASAEEVGLPEYLVPGTVTAIEWAAPLLPYLREHGDNIVVHRLAFTGENETDRTIRFLAL
jgi:L-threonylcarbamoyladenylate synthase